MATIPTPLPENPSLQDLRSALGKPAPVTDNTAPATTDAPVDAAPPADKPAEVLPPVDTPPVDVPVAPVDKKPKRFSELTKRAQEAEARATEALAEVARLKAATAVPATPAPVIPPVEGKPTQPDATTFTGTWQELETARAKYTEDYAAWAVRDALHKQEVTKAQQAAKEQADAVNKTFQEQYEAAIETNEHAEAATAKVAAVVGKMGIGDVIKESPVAMEIILALDADAAALEKLGKMSIASAAREIGRIEVAVMAKREAAKTAPATKLPDPPSVVGGGAAGGAPPVDLNKLGDLSMSELRKVVKPMLGSTRTGLSWRK